MKRFIVALAVVSGCGAAQVPTTDENVVFEQLWTEVFQESPRTVPVVLWVEDLDAECDGKGKVSETGGCINGQAPDSSTVLLARWPGMKLWESTVSHEFAHAQNMLHGDNGDAWHRTSPFQPGGTVDVGVNWLRNIAP